MLHLRHAGSHYLMKKAEELRCTYGYWMQRDWRKAGWDGGTSSKAVAL